MSWLRWLATPIIAVWNYIADAFFWAWGVLKIAWNGTKKSLDSTYWKVGTIGLSVGLYLLFLFVFIAIKLEAGVLVVPGVIGLISAAFWTMGAITGLIKYKKENGSFPEGGVKPLLGNGMATMKFVLLSIGIITVLVLFVALLALLGMIPGIGPILLGIFSLPMVLSSAVIVLIAIMLAFGNGLVPAHLLHAQSSEGTFVDNYKKTSKALLKVIAKKWLDIVIAGYPAVLFAYIVAILPGMLAASSVAVSMGITAGVADITGGMDFEYLASMTGFSGSLGLIFGMVTGCLLAGFVMSFVYSAITSVVYEIYLDSREASFFKKVVGLLSLFAVSFPVLGFVTGFLGMLFMF